jgi:endo-1,4-beta-xylanase
MLQLFNYRVLHGFALLFLASHLVPAPLAAQQATPALRQLAKPFFSVGAGVGVQITEHPEDWKLLTTHFEYVTPENCMKVQAVQNVANQFRFETADRFVQFATERNLKIVGHCLVWAKDDRTPEWFFQDGDHAASAELLLSRMQTHIETVVSRYKGKIAMWDVVNEALSDGSDGYLRDSGWVRATGEEFIVKAFEYAHAADPDAFLIYNDYRCDTQDKRDKLLRLARMLKSRNAPVAAIGLQGHYELDSVPFEGLEEMLKAMREIGFKVVVSELDIDVVKRGRWWAENGRFREELATYDPYREGCPPDVLQRQAEQYAKLFQLFVKYDDVIQRVSFWNLHDGQSWLNYFPWRRVNHPLLFDRQRQPKPAFEAVARVLVEAAENQR